MAQYQTIFFHVMVSLSSQQVLSVNISLLPLTQLQPRSSFFTFDRSVGNTDPRMRIVLVHGLNSNFNSVLEVLQTGRDFQYRSNPHISLDPPFWLRSWMISRKGVFATSHCLLKFTSISCQEMSSTTRISPASSQNLLTLSPGESDSIC